LNIIIKTPNFIGDTIMMLPALELLKMEYPDAKFTVVCKKPSRDIFRDKDIEEIIIDDTKGKNRFSKTIKLVKTIKNKHYDLGILFHNTFIDALIFKLSHIDTIIGYEKENRKILLDFWLKIDKTRHYVNHYANLVNQYLGNKYTTLPQMKLHTQKQHLIKKDEKTVIGFVLGSDKDSRGYPKELSLRLFSKLKNRDFHIVLIGDENDLKSNILYEKQLKKDQITCTNLTAKTSVAEFIDIINDLDLLITIDTSALHIAASTGTDFIALIGKGSSAFDTVKPKVEFGSYIFKGERYIKDEDLIKEIKADDIIKEIDKRLKIGR